MPLKDWLGRPLPEIPRVTDVEGCIRDYRRSFSEDCEAVGAIIKGINMKGTAMIRLERVQLRTKRRYHYSIISEFASRSTSKTNPWKTNKGTVEGASSLFVRAWTIVRHAK